MKKGDKNFWKAIDNSYQRENIEKVQKHLGDSEPMNFDIEDTRIEFVKNEKGEVVDVNPKTTIINK